MIKFDLDCRACGSSNTSVVLETAYQQVCEDCDHQFDIRPQEVIDDDRLYTFIY
jgi:ribosome-binding protein aMBF1 (putative translation factor)